MAVEFCPRPSPEALRSGERRITLTWHPRPLLSIQSVADVPVYQELNTQHEMNTE